MSFKTAIKKVLEHEGGWVNNPNDRGGETYQGISRKFHPDWGGWSMIDEVRQKYHGEIFPIIRDSGLVESFYHVKFWLKNRLSEVKNDHVAGLIFDWVVNSGGAVKEIQKVLKKMGHDIVADGVIGPNTLNAINSVDAQQLTNNIVEKRITYYKVGVQQGWLDSSFLKGLTARAESYYLEMGKQTQLT